jgi:hypothetical protein
MKHFFYCLVLFICLACSSKENELSSVSKRVVREKSTSEVASHKSNVDSKSKPNTSVYTKKSKLYNFTACSSDIGWGYDILENGKVIVHQPHIPAIQGLKGFTSKSKAEKVAQAVVKKCEQGISPPTLSIEEMNQLGVLN